MKNLLGVIVSNMFGTFNSLEESDIDFPKPRYIQIEKLPTVAPMFFPKEPKPYVKGQTYKHKKRK